MSMYRQLWLAIIVSMLLALTGSLFASMLSARSYLQSQLSIKNADNAAALALSLAEQKDGAAVWRIDFEGDRVSINGRVVSPGTRPPPIQKSGLPSSP